MPFIIFPSALLWNTQFHNENYVIPGVFLVLYGWIGVITMNEKKALPKSNLLYGLWLSQTLLNRAKRLLMRLEMN